MNNILKKETAYFKDSIEERINNFNVFRFVGNGEKSSDENGNGAFAVFTENQYIIATTEFDGMGVHTNSFAEAMALLEGKEINLEDYKERLIEYSKLCKNFINARIVCEKIYDTDRINKNFHFVFPREYVSQNEYNTIKEFSTIFSGIFRKLKFKITAEFLSFNDLESFKSIDELTEYLLRRIKIDFKNDFLESENIIGTQTYINTKTK